MCGVLDEVDAARIDDDQPGARLAGLAAQALLHARGEDRMAVGRIGADDEDDVAVFDAVEVLGAGRSAEGGVQAVAPSASGRARAQVSMLLLPKPARTIFWTT